MSGTLFGRLTGRARRADAAAVAVAAAAARRAANPVAPQDAVRGRTIVPGDYGMPARAELRTDLIRPLPALHAARAAAEAGDWRPASAVMQQAGGDWEFRYLCTTWFAELAPKDDAWLRAWRREAPEDPAAAVIHARSLVDIAWSIRGSGWAKDVTPEQWEGFHRVLEQAPEACLAAAELFPADPTPWIVHFGVALGLGYSHDDFRALWAQASARDPFHVKAHLAAMDYWRPRWHGSPELMSGFVENAIATAPRGSLLTLLRLDMLNTEQKPKEAEEQAAFWQSPEVRHAIDAGLADLAAARPDHLRVDALRSWLAFFLTKSGRYAEAVWMFRRLGDCAAAQPWSYSADGTALFTATRVNAVLGWEDAGRPALPDGRSPLSDH